MSDSVQIDSQPISQLDYETSEEAQSDNQSDDQTIDQSINLSNNQSNSPTNNQSNNQSSTESNNQLNNHSIEENVAVMSSLGVRAARARRSLHSNDQSNNQSTNQSVKQGKGMLLCEIPNVSHRIDKSRSSSLEFKRFLTLIFPKEKVQKNKLKNFAKNHFKGLPDDVIDHVSGKLRKYLIEDEPHVLSKLFALMDLEYEIDEDDPQVSIERNHANALKFLINPQPTGKDPVKLKIRAKPVRKDNGKKRSLSKKGEPLTKKQRVAEAAKKSPNPFVIFMTAQRDEVRTQYPDLTIQQVTAKLGDLWRNLPDEDREVYELAAKKLKEDAILEEQLRQRDEDHTKKTKKSSVKPAKKKASEKPSKQPAPVEVSDNQSNSESGSGSDDEDAQSQSQSDDDVDGSVSEDTQDEDESELAMEQ